VKFGTSCVSWSRGSLRLEYGGVTHRTTLGLERDDHLTGWLILAWFLWFTLASSTVINAWVFAQKEEAFFEWSPTVVAIMVPFGVMFGFFSYRVSLRVVRGPGQSSKRPILRYFATTLLAMLLAWAVAVLGMVCWLYDAHYVAVLLAFFVPTWLLFLMNAPTRAKLGRWVDVGDRPEIVEPS
jgi:hypothetical protein